MLSFIWFLFEFIPIFKNLYKKDIDIHAMLSSDKLVCKKCSGDRGFIKSDTIVAHFPLLDNTHLIQYTWLAFIMLRKSDALLSPSSIDGIITIYNAL